MSFRAVGSVTLVCRKSLLVMCWHALFLQRHFYDVVHIRTWAFVLGAAFFFLLITLLAGILKCSISGQRLLDRNIQKKCAVFSAPYVSYVLHLQEQRFLWAKQAEEKTPEDFWRRLIAIKKDATSMQDQQNNTEIKMAHR